MKASARQRRCRGGRCRRGNHSWTSYHIPTGQEARNLTTSNMALADANSRLAEAMEVRNAATEREAQEGRQALQALSKKQWVVF